MGAVRSLDETDFRGTRLALPGRVAVLFRMPTCPYSRAFRSRYAQLEAPADVCLADYAVGDFYDTVPLSLEVSVVPTVVGFEEGEVVWRHDGAPGRGLGEATLKRIRVWGTPPATEGKGPS